MGRPRNLKPLTDEGVGWMRIRGTLISMGKEGSQCLEVTGPTVPQIHQRALPCEVGSATVL